MKKRNAGDGEMPGENEEMKAQEAGANAQDAPAKEIAAGANEPVEVESPGKQPEFRLVQPEYDTRDEKTIFKDVGAVWKNVSQKTGREFYTLKIGKLRLLMFPNQKLEQGGQ